MNHTGRARTCPGKSGKSWNLIATFQDWKVLEKANGPGKCQTQVKTMKCMADSKDNCN